MPLLPKYYRFNITWRQTGPRATPGQVLSVPIAAGLSFASLVSGQATALGRFPIFLWEAAPSLLALHCTLLQSDLGRPEAARDTLAALHLMNPDPQPRFITQNGTEDSELKGRALVPALES